MDYIQPEFYKFSEDSIILSKMILDSLREENLPGQLLDVGCGCGVIGIEVMRQTHPGSLNSLILLEKQKEFVPYIEKNVSQFLSHETKVSIINQDFIDLKDAGPITHIVSNPPYFLEGKSRLSPNTFKKNCRSWKPDTAVKFLEKFVFSCKEHNAKGFLCGRKELQELMDQLKISYEILNKNKETSFYLLF